MPTITIPWTTGTGNIVVEHQGAGSGQLLVSSDTPNPSSSERAQTLVVATSAGSPQRSVTLTVRQGPKLNPYLLLEGGGRVLLASGGGIALDGVGQTVPDIPDIPPEPVVDVLEFSYTGSVQTLALVPGTYELEVWGAQGGTYSSNHGGLGGHSVGTLVVTEETTAYIHVGGQPATVTTMPGSVAGGYNGGGKGQNRRSNSSSYSTYGQGGGGASDIRVGTDSLLARVIVAGGGGGSASRGDDRSAKCGGGETGGAGTRSGYSYVAGQTAPTSSGSYLAGTFGVGADAYQSGTSSRYGSGGGGGGWYGGYAYNSAGSTSGYRGYNGGGSGYVYTAQTAASYPGGCLLTSAQHLTDAATYPGSDTSHGREGHGFVRITRTTYQ